MRHLPNLICVARLLLIIPIVSALGEERYVAALGWFVFAAVSDGVDGWLAKRFGWTSELGKFLDPLADKLLLVAVFLVATWSALVPWWVTAAAVSRDVMIGLGALFFRIFFGPLRGRPTRISKINTAVQLTFLSTVMLNAAIEVFPDEVIAALAVLTFAFTVLSGLDYVVAFTRRALETPGRAAA
jgi:cardiolipin synthase